ncbi:hypothetical protein [Longimicrobium sp.]|uniref:hypothetical protein n=1 Tax=Longimicrobium sp. TaxID=2029185 RepID=UPI002E2EFB4A|nr:hypothetical protein [Longimicrobium sp.]HEX6040117.1 hypothetical protein [Longimicrobium sp.]
MRKIQLKLESLAAESFQTDAVPATRGTVEGRQDDAALLAVSRVNPLCQTYKCVYTEWYSCAVENTLPASCQYGCDCTQAGSPC